MILWKGHCSVHDALHRQADRSGSPQHPGIRVIVHPEVPWDVVQAADDSGSTEYIIKTVTQQSRQAQSGRSAPRSTSSTVSLTRWRPDRTVISLDQFGCLCSTMFRVSPNHLLWILEELVEGRVHNRIVVPEEQKHWNRVALERMLSISVEAGLQPALTSLVESAFRRTLDRCSPILLSQRRNAWRTNCPSSHTTSPRSSRTSTRRRCRSITGSIIRRTSPI